MPCFVAGLIQCEMCRKEIQWIRKVSSFLGSSCMCCVVTLNICGVFEYCVLEPPFHDD